MTTTNYGFDLACGVGADGFFDLDVYAPPIRGTAALAQALAHRLVTPRGSLLDDASFGMDIRAALNDSLDDADLREIARAAEEECRADERVDDVALTVVLDGDRLTVTGTVFPVVGRSFALVLSLSDASAQLLTTGTNDR